MYLVLTCCVIIISCWYLHLQKYFRFLKNVPGPTPWPIIGNVPQIGIKTTDFLTSLHRLSKEHGGVSKFLLGEKPMMIITDHEIIKTFLSSTTIIDKSFTYHFLENWLGEGLLISPGAKWKERRKIIAPAYHYQILEKFIDTFDNVANVLIGEMKNEVNNSSVDINNLISACTLDVICETAMGVSVNALQNKDCDYFRAVKEMCEIIISRTINPLLQPNFLYKFSKTYKNEKKCIKILHDYTYNVIQRKRKEIKDEKEGKNEEDEFVKKKFAFMDLLLRYEQNGKPLSDDDVREEVDTFMFAGHDTTSAAISFALYNLSQHPEVQEKAFKEQEAIFGENKNVPVTSKELSEMNYLECVIKETLRLYPSVPIYARKIMEDTYFDSLSLTLPKGLTVLIFAYGIHRNEKYFKKAFEFDPERFMDNESIKQNPYSYIPFSLGPRNCIGQKFAMLETKCVLSKLIRNFKFSPSVPEHNIELSAEAVLTSKNGIKMKFSPR